MKTQQLAELFQVLEPIMGKRGVLALLELIDMKVEDEMMTAKSDIISEIRATQSEVRATKVYNIIAVITLVTAIVSCIGYFAALALGIIGK